MKNHSRVSIIGVGMLSVLVACEGIIEDPSGVYALSEDSAETSSELQAAQVEERDAAMSPDSEEDADRASARAAISGVTRVQSKATRAAQPGASDAQQAAADAEHAASDAQQAAADTKQGASDARQGAPDAQQAAADTKRVAADTEHAATEAAQPSASVASSPSADLVTRVGSGDLASPLAGPAPYEAKHLQGEPYKLVKNWDFGAGGTIRSRADLEAEFQFHDQFKTIANGTNYGAVTVASCQETAIGASGLGLPSDNQPIEKESDPTREWTSDTMLSHVRPLSKTQQTVSAARHDAGNGSLMAKWSLPTGGKLLGQDMVWETRVRMPKPLPGFWFALWTAGDRWSKGAEMDVVESFGTPNINFDAFHSDSVGGTNEIEYKSWPDALDEVGVPDDQRELADWHIWTWVYNRDDSYEVFYDGHRVQHGVIHWTDGGGANGTPIDMRFLFDFSWGHTQVSDVNIELPASMFPLTYEIDYSRVYLR